MHCFLTSAYVAKILSGVCLSVVVVLIKAASMRTGLAEILLARGSIPALIIMVWSLVSTRGGSLRSSAPLWQGTRAVLGVTAMTCTYGSIARLPIAEAQVLAFLTPLVAVALSAATLKEPPTGLQVCATALGLCGVCVAFFLDSSAQTATNDYWWGVILGLVGSFLGASSFIAGRRLAKADSLEATTFYFAFAVVLLSLAKSGGQYQGVDTEALFLLIAIGIFALLGHLLLVKALALDTVAATAQMDYLNFVWVLILGFHLLDEMPRVGSVVGGIMIVTAALALARRPPTTKPG